MIIFVNFLTIFFKKYEIVRSLKSWTLSINISRLQTQAD